MMAIMQTPISPTPQQEATQLATSSKKRKRNEKTRHQYKRRAVQQATPSTPKQQATQPVTIPEQKQCSAENIAEKSSSSSKIHGCNSFRLRFLAKKPYYYTVLSSLPGYIGYAEEMEATGQG